MLGNVCSCHGWSFKSGSGRSGHERFVGVPLSVEHRKKLSEAAMGNRRGWHHTEETKKRISESIAQRSQVERDFPDPLGTCGIPGCEEEAEERARLDHMTLPYRPELVLPMCRSCNAHHNNNGFLVFLPDSPSKGLG